MEQTEAARPSANAADEKNAVRRAGRPRPKRRVLPPLQSRAALLFYAGTGRPGMRGGRTGYAMLPRKRLAMAWDTPGIPLQKVMASAGAYARRRCASAWRGNRPAEPAVRYARQKETNARLGRIGKKAKPRGSVPTRRRGGLAGAHRSARKWSAARRKAALERPGEAARDFLLPMAPFALPSRTETMRGPQPNDLDGWRRSRLKRQTRSATRRWLLARMAQPIEKQGRAGVRHARPGGSGCACERPSFRPQTGEGRRWLAATVYACGFIGLYMRAASPKNRRIGTVLATIAVAFKGNVC